jgi:hypothetical protein
MIRRKLQRPPQQVWRIPIIALAAAAVDLQSSGTAARAAAKSAGSIQRFSGLRKRAQF